MHREPLLALLARYEKRYPEESRTAERIRTLVQSRPRCFERDCGPGHVTASAWILSADRTRFLLTHHRKLGRWLQLGGHADGQSDVREVALREAREESGMSELQFVVARDGLRLEGEIAIEPFDLDVHRIPARGPDPEHEHHDVRFLLVAGPGQPLAISSESNDLRWFPVDALESVATDDSVQRLGRKAQRVLARPHALRSLPTTSR